jgi:hypothetical protein
MLPVEDMWTLNDRAISVRVQCVRPRSYVRVLRVQHNYGSNVRLPLDRAATVIGRKYGLLSQNKKPVWTQ